MDHDIPPASPNGKRPSFHLAGDESSDEEDGLTRYDTTRNPRADANNHGSPLSISVPTALAPPSSPAPQLATSMIDKAILKFPQESLHSFSYASVSQNSISQRISVLKRSLEFLQEHPLMLHDLQKSLSSVSLASTAEAFTERSGVLQHVLSNIRSSASSATLSMLNSISSPAPSPSTGGGPGINRTAHYQQSPRPMPKGRNDDPTSQSGAAAQPFNENLQKVLETLENAYSSQDRAGMLFSSPGLNLSKDGSRAKSLSGVANNPKPASRSVSLSESSGNDLGGTMAHQRALTGNSALNVESQILEALATPYVDVAWQAMMQKSGSVTNVPAMVHSVSTLSLSSFGSEVNAPTITPLSTVASKHASKHSIFTTKDSAPFQILSSNDIACLVFGISQHEMRSRSIMDIILPQEHQALIGALKACDKTVPLCGALFPIIKSNGHENVASFWVKYNSKGFLIWVVEEVLRDKAMVTMNNDFKVDNVRGVNYSSLVSDAIGKDISEVVPTLDKQRYNEWQYSTISYEGSNVPGFANLQCKNDADITSMPHMAGLVILDKGSLSIVDYNKLFLYHLLGIKDTVVGQSIDKIIPQFSDYLRLIVDVHQLDAALGNVGLVIPEHMFRKSAAMAKKPTSAKQRVPTSPLPSTSNLQGEWRLPGAPSSNADQDVLDRYADFVSSTGIPARNIHGDSIIVDVQLRVVSPCYFALWVTYSRNTREFRAQSEVPSQLKLFYEVQDRRKKKAEGNHSSDHSRDSSLSQSGGSASSLSISDSNTNATSASQSGETDVSIDLVQYAKHTPEIGAKRRIKQIEDFEIKYKMGEGAYGKVLLVQYKQEPRVIVVIKCVIKERILVDTWTRDRKLGTIPNEIKVMATLNNSPHENIIRLLDFFEDEDYYHIEMERHGNPGTDLFDLIELKPNMEEQKCKRIFLQVARAVQHLHNNGIVHRDIKDENVVVDNDVKVKLIDFGSSAFTRQGPFDVFVGTMDYAAPEVLGGRPYAGMPQDVWALGILLYTIIYKENPFYNVDEIMDGDLRIPYVTSESCLDLVNLILCRDVDARPTIDQIVDHPWFHS